MSNEQPRTPLALKIEERIRREGPLPVADYMQICLYDHEYGYYQHQAAIGAAEDFITAPEISQVFGELLGLWSGVVWRLMGAPQRLNLVELGPGRGTMMQDALRAAGAVPGFREALEVHLIENNPVLAARQKETLAAETVPLVWHQGPATLPEGPTLILANEFLDTLPVEQAVFNKGHWYRRGVGVGEHGLEFCLGEQLPGFPFAPLVSDEPGEGDVFEFRPDVEQAILPMLEARARQAPLAGLFIDYGHLRSGFGDTLQAIARQQAVTPLSAPGESDLTAQVDFQQLAHCFSGTDTGLVVDGPMSQAEFLGYLGIIERASRLMSANPASAATIEAGVARLIAPAGMGSRFKVIGVRSAALPPLPALVAMDSTAPAP